MVVGDMPSFSGIPAPFRRERSTGHAKYTNGVKSFMNGIVSPFTACWQPTVTSCVPSCGAPDFRYRPSHESPSVVSPLADRLSPHSHPASPRPDVSASYHQSSVSPTRDVAEESHSATDIDKPHENDVLCGRGGSSNRHLGNMHFRELVAANKQTYVGLTKKQKMLVARKIVEMVHSTDPPGRFLAKDLDNGRWYDIGVPRSLEKTSQALREKNSNDFPALQDREANETSTEVSAHGSLISDAGASGVDEAPTKTSRSSKNVEAPPLTIPPHLREVFGPKQPKEAHHRPWPDYHPSSRHLEQPFLHSYSPSSPPGDHYHVSPRPRSYHYGSAPPRTPPHYYDRSPPYSHSEAPHYGHSPPSYGHHEPPQDHREHYDYYPRRLDHPEHYTSRLSPRSSPHSGRLPPPMPGHYRAYPPPPPPPPPRPPHHHRHPHHPPPRTAHPPPSPPVSRQTPPPYDHHYYDGHPSTPPAPPVPSYRSSSSNGYVRSKSEVSPDRRQEWKRQRNENGNVIRRLSDTSLSKAVEHSLSLEERVVGRERRPKELMSPSGVLQSRSRRSMANKPPKVEERPDLSKLSGLAALSTAAFLKLDEA